LELESLAGGDLSGLEADSGHVRTFIPKYFPSRAGKKNNRKMFIKSGIFFCINILNLLCLDSNKSF
jgi:hypothetical protein